MQSNQPQARAIALLPLFFFLALFFGAGLYFTLQGDEMGFYHLHAPVAMLPALIVALLLGVSYQQHSKPMDTLLKGMGEPNIMLMCLIFFLAGAFAKVTQAIGGIDAAVYFGVSSLPAHLLLPGIFVASALISLAMGTSMGTIAAVAPIALGLAQAAGLNLPLTLGTVVGGAMFGDNLSFISDTTIAATRTQGAKMADKFKENFWIALPAALITLSVLAFMPAGSEEATSKASSLVLAMPYVAVLVLAMFGLDVLSALVIGIIFAGALGITLVPDYSLVTLAEDIWQGFMPMVEITILSILVGGLAALMREQGGLAWLTQTITRLAGKNAGKRSGEAGIAALGALTNVFIANNTVSILVAGPVAKELADNYGISPKRSASLMDIFSCVVQGILPYGAQILLAASLAGVSPLAIAGNAFYCWALAGITICAIIFNWPRARQSAS